MFRDHEQHWPPALRFVLYLVGLLWLFLGVALISDRFMGAIEKITSKKRRWFNKTTGRYVTSYAWNATVANLTLMALGSSAPEILLSVMELLFNRFFTGELGPSTIVGSAAFNLLCITAVCMIAIPDGEKRHIKELPVYVVTASFSVFAYLWLLVILLGNSPHIIEVWEGLLTLAFFPIFVLIAFLADKGYLSCRGFFRQEDEEAPALSASADMSKEELAAIAAKIRQEKGAHLTNKQVMGIIEHEYQAPRSRLRYRVDAVRELTGGRRACKRMNDPLFNVVPTVDAGDDMSVANKKQASPMQANIEFAAAKYTVLENGGSIQLVVLRMSKDLDICTSVGYTTRDGTAKAPGDYITTKGTLEFQPGESSKIIEVKINNDNQFEQDEEFYVDLLEVNGGVQLGALQTTMVMIIDDDLPGVLSFAHDAFHVQESLEDHYVELIVTRTGGGSGVVGCKYHTEDDTAVSGPDFEAILSGQLEFQCGQMEATIKVKIKARGRYESTEMFRVVLTEPFGGATFNEETDGGKDSCISSVIIEPDESNMQRVDRIMSMLQVNWDKTKLGNDNWRDQFKEALLVNGGDDEAGNASCLDWAMHVLNCPWKLICACVPPVDFLDGWACFCCALLVIGMVTALIGELANLLGCLVGMPGEITAITLVALGTSLPDTFASKAAAQQDPHADASIGNVTGSNSVNVFLGLGLPWLMGSIYWVANGPDQEWLERYGQKDFAQPWLSGAFVVEAGNLGFSVGVFSACALTCIGLLAVRRVALGGELGGPARIRYLTSLILVCLWLFYVGLSIWHILSQLPDA